MRRIKKSGTLLLAGLLTLAFASALVGCQKADDADGGLTEILPEEVAEEMPGSEEPDGEEAAGGEEETAKAPARIFVHVCGQVEVPGVYELEAGSRLFEALDLAGGLTAEAAGEVLNQAQILTDGQQVYVPSKEEAQEGSPLWQGPSANEQAADPAGAGEKDGRVNINQAAKEELMTLTGIGEVRAEAIIRYREEHGPFGSIEELKEIDGIKDGIFQKIRDDITI